MMAWEKGMASGWAAGLHMAHGPQIGYVYIRGKSLEELLALVWTLLISGFGQMISSRVYT